MPKPIERLASSVFNTLPKLVNQEGMHSNKVHGMNRAATSRLARSALLACGPLISSNLIREQSTRSVLPQLRGLPSFRAPIAIGAVRTHSTDLPSTALIARYKPVLEQAIAN